MKNIFILTVLIFLSNNLFQSLNACSCTPPEPPNIEYNNYGAVFTGKVVEISIISRYGYPFRLVKFEVDKKWKGVYGNEVIVITAKNSAACGYDFVLDTLYLVYANFDNDTLWTDLCTRTNPVWLAEEDIAFLNTVKENHVLQPFGLQDKVITSLAVEQLDYNSTFQLSDKVFAGTAEDGVFETSATGESPDWVSIGLSDKSVTALTVQHWGTGPVDGLTLFAAVTADYEPDDSTLIFRREAHLPTDTNWVASDSGIDKNVSSINTLNSYYFTGHTAPQPILGGSNKGFYQASWVGNLWTQSEIENENLQPTIISIDVNPHWVFLQDPIAWAAGYIGLSSAAFRSTDRGETWRVFPLSDAQEYVPASSVAVNTRSSDSVYISRNREILLTPDNGENWEPVFSSRGIFINSLAIDPLYPENVFAGGWFFDDSGQSPSYGVFLHSTNGGKDWNDIATASDPSFENITSIVVSRKPDDDYGYVFIGTAGTGIWRYKYKTSKNTDSDYFPLALNNEWNYTSNLFPHTEKFTDSLRINNKLYYSLSMNDAEPYLFFRQLENKVFVLDISDSTEAMLYDFDAEIGESWELPESFYCNYGKEITLVSKSDTVEAPAGTFYNCYHFTHSPFCTDAGITDTWLAKGTGKVRYKEIFIAGEGDFVLTDYVTSVDNNSEQLKDFSYKLFQNYPNPFNPTTTIKYELPEDSKAELFIYNILGEKIAELVNIYQKAGGYEVKWNAGNLSSGIYFYKLSVSAWPGQDGQTENYSSTKKMILLK